MCSADRDKGQSAVLKGSNVVPATGIDLEFETDGKVSCCAHHSCCNISNGHQVCVLSEKQI
jgi:hypothetical protein